MATPNWLVEWNPTPQKRSLQLLLSTSSKVTTQYLKNTPMNYITTSLLLILQHVLPKMSFPVSTISAEDQIPIWVLMLNVHGTSTTHLGIRRQKIRSTDYCENHRGLAFGSTAVVEMDVKNWMRRHLEEMDLRTFLLRADWIADRFPTSLHFPEKKTSTTI